MQQAARFQSLSAVNSPYLGLAPPHAYSQPSLYNTLSEDDNGLGVDMSMYGRWSQGDIAYRRQQQGKKTHLYCIIF